MAENPMTTAQAKEKFLLILHEILRLKDIQDQRLQKSAYLKGRADAFAVVCKYFTTDTPKSASEILDIIERETVAILAGTVELEKLHETEKQDAAGLIAMIEGFGENEPIN